MGSSQWPWFKFFPSDFLLDGDVDSLPLEAQAVLIRMWCLCHIEGSCPVDPREIARKSRLTSEQINQHLPDLLGFFEERQGRLYSRRMEEEKQKSDVARRNGQKRGEQIRSASRSADGSADCLAQSQSQSQSQSQNQSPPPFSQEDFDLSFQKKNGVSQTDFDERDLRALAKAKKTILLRVKAIEGVGCVSEAEFMSAVCAESGLLPDRVRELEEKSKWVGASA